MRRNRETEPHVLLITGRPGIGKTTVIRRVAGQLEGRRLCGFYTEEVREGGERRGFRLVGLDGTRRMIAHIEFPKSHSVGKYGVDVDAIGQAVAIIRPDSTVQAYLVDEIGKMECLSEDFVAAMRMLISGHTPLVATVGARGGGFIAEVKCRPECELWEVTRDNRDALPSRICVWMTERM
jgi:nucleoside-triphosphatase